MYVEMKNLLSFKDVDLDLIKKTEKEYLEVKKNGAYPKEFGTVYFFFLDKEKQLKNNLKFLEDIKKNIKEAIDYLNGHVDSLKDPDLYDLTLKQLSLDWQNYEEHLSNIELNINKVQNELNDLNAFCWNFALSEIVRSEMLDSYGFSFDDYVDEFKYLSIIPFCAKNFIEETDNILKKIFNIYSKDFLAKFVSKLLYNDEIAESGEAKDVIKTNWLDIWENSLYGEKRFSSNKAKYGISKMFYLLNADREEKRSYKNEIEKVSEDLEYLNIQGKRLKIEICDCKISFYKTKDTEIVLSKQAKDLLEKEAKKQIEERKKRYK